MSHDTGNPYVLVKQVIAEVNWAYPQKQLLLFSTLLSVGTNNTNCRNAHDKVDVVDILLKVTWAGMSIFYTS